MKDTVTPAELSVNEEHLADAITEAAAMDVKAKEDVCDRIHATQPNLLASVLTLPLLGVPMETVDVILDILITLHLAVENSGQTLVMVSEEDQERQLRRFTAAVRFAEELDEQSFIQSLRQTTAYSKERILIAYVVGILHSSGIVGQREEHAKYSMMAAINLVNCIATAKRAN